MDAPEDRAKALNEHMSSGFARRHCCCVPARRANSRPEQVQQTPQLLDHLVGEQHERIREREPDRLGGLEIDDQLVAGRPLER